MTEAGPPTTHTRSKVKIRIGNGYVHFYNFTYHKKWKDDIPRQVCPLCNQEFKTGDPIFIVLTNSTFPNTLIHQGCVDHDLILTTHALLKSYESFEQFNKTHRGWKPE